MNIISLFSGAGGLDLGFHQAGFNTIWANEYDKEIWETFETNFSYTKLDRRSIVNIPSSEIPDAIGLIGGPPCQSWSEAGSLRGINDKRGQLFFEFIRVLRDKKPLFFLAENVGGIYSANAGKALKRILHELNHAGEHGYNLTVHLYKFEEYGIPQNRHRLIIVGFRGDLKKTFKVPKPSKIIVNCKDAICNPPIPAYNVKKDLPFHKNGIMHLFEGSCRFHQKDQICDAA